MGFDLRKANPLRRSTSSIGKESAFQLLLDLLHLLVEEAELRI